MGGWQSSRGGKTDMHHWPYHAVPSDEPPPASMCRQAQKVADNEGVPVRISDVQGLEFKTYWPEV